MSRDHETGRKSRGKNVEISVHVTVDDSEYHVKPQITNYEHFDVAARLSFPLPDALKARHISPSSKEEDVWTLEDGELVLIERIEWASDLERAFLLEAADRSQVEVLVDDATIELTDMNGNELAVHSEFQTELPPPRSTKPEELASHRTEAQPDSGGADDRGENAGDAGRTADEENDLEFAETDSDEVDDQLDPPEAPRNRAEDTGEEGGGTDQTPAARSDQSAGDPGTAERGGKADRLEAPRSETPNAGPDAAKADKTADTESDQESEEKGGKKGENQSVGPAPHGRGAAEAGLDGPLISNSADADDTADTEDERNAEQEAGRFNPLETPRDPGEDTGETGSATQQTEDSLGGLPSVVSTDPAIDSDTDNADKPVFEWVNVEYDKQDADTDTIDTDGLLTRLRSLFLE